MRQTCPAIRGPLFGWSTCSPNVYGGSAGQANQLMSSELVRWNKLITEANIRLK